MHKHKYFHLKNNYGSSIKNNDFRAKKHKCHESNCHESNTYVSIQTGVDKILRELQRLYLM